MRWAVLAVVAIATACSSTDKKEPQKPSDRDGGIAIPASCTERQDHVRALYAADPALAKVESAELRADLLNANVDVAMRDCATDAAAISPCLADARDVATIEKRCLIPLDDAGQVEHRAFGRNQ